MNLKIGIGHYRKEDYLEILNISEDKEDMDPTWEIWNDSKNKLLKNFHKMGVHPVKIIVTPKALVKYCRERGLKINGKSRTDFISHETKRLDQKGNL